MSPNGTAEENGSKEFSFETWFLSCALVLNISGAGSNAFAAWRTWKTFTLSKAIYLILFLDSCWNAAGLFVTSVTTMYQFVDKTNSVQNRTWCNLFMGAVFISITLGNFMVCIICRIRLVAFINSY